MSGELRRVHDALVHALKGVADLDVAQRPGQVLNPPAAYVGPPTLTWDAYEPQAREAVFEVVLAAPLSGEAVDVLYDYLPRVSEALDTIPRDPAQPHSADVVVKTAEPGVWQSGTVSLPCYFIRVEAVLSDGST
jgi:hypothetical protein